MSNFMTNAREVLLLDACVEAFAQPMIHQPHSSRLPKLKPCSVPTPYLCLSPTRLAVARNGIRRELVRISRRARVNDSLYGRCWPHHYP
ncbi:hypothetical protein IF2G_03209 [Cordyceps javanica]|nr:hypothetical protein IF2G_03209 [Cordyceps javanica]